jgi:GNAT superfamily N-acetyltransferase
VTARTLRAALLADSEGVAPPVLIRPIRPADRVLLAEGFAHLSPESVRLRFLAPKARLSAKELSYLTEVDGVDHVALVAEDAQRPGEMVAVGRWVRLVDDPTAAEVAIVVADAHQGQGLGRQLGLALADAARERGVERFTATLLSENAAAHRLFAAISERLVAHHAGGIEELVAELRPAA